jgi:hypothetical protein
MCTGIAREVLSPAELARRCNALQRDRSTPDFCECAASSPALSLALPAGT